jgi:DNA-binding transcriptional regulator GbsR (MarR family)
MISLISVNTEIKEIKMNLSPTAQKFILHWGEMGGRWGVNRTVAQIHALLYLSPHPLNAEDIMETLGVARSNVSNSLHELRSFDLVKVVHVLGDRRDHFEAVHDVWEMFTRIVEHRKKRELDPTLQLLRECAEDAQKDKQLHENSRQRINAMLEFVEVANQWYGSLIGLKRELAIKLMKLGSKIVNLVK